MRYRSLIFVLLTALFTNLLAMNVRADEPTKGPSVTFSWSLKSQYVGTGFVFEKKPVFQTDLFIAGGDGRLKGWSFDFWTSASTTKPGLKRMNGPGNEVDLSVARVWNPGVFELTAEVAYYQIVPMDDWSDDYWRGKVALARPFSKSGLTPHAEIQQYVGSGKHSLVGGQYILFGLGSSKGFTQDLTFTHDGGVAGGERGFIAHWSAGKSFRTDKQVGFSVGIDLWQPISVSDRDFEWVLSLGGSMKLR